jgi:hypothetical protein
MAMKYENENSKNQITPPSSTITIFWSGGWDSTFRVLYILTQTNCNVRAYYVYPLSNKKKTARNSIYS